MGSWTRYHGTVLTAQVAKSGVPSASKVGIDTGKVVGAAPGGVTVTVPFTVPTPRATSGNTARPLASVVRANTDGSTAIPSARAKSIRAPATTRPLDLLTTATE